MNEWHLLLENIVDVVKTRYLSLRGKYGSDILLLNSLKYTFYFYHLIFCLLLVISSAVFMLHVIFMGILQQNEDVACKTKMQVNSKKEIFFEVQATLDLSLIHI